MNDCRYTGILPHQFKGPIELIGTNRLRDLLPHLLWLHACILKSARTL